MRFLAIDPSRTDDLTRKQPRSESMEDTAIIPITGLLTHHEIEAPFSSTSYDEIWSALEEVLETSSISRIILDIDSPGGEVSGLFDLCDFIYEARGTKSIEAFANDYAFSAAYAIASSAEKVLCSRTSGVGSIGVIATHVDISGYDEKNGLKFTDIFEGSRKNDLSPHAPLTDEARFETQKEIKRLYELFVRTVARN